MPAPKNDFEIVIPDEENENESSTDRMDTGEEYEVPDQADLEAKRNYELEQKRKCLQ